MQDVSGRARELLEFLVILLSIAVAYKLGYITLHSFIFANCISVKLMTLLVLSVYNKYSLTSEYGAYHCICYPSHCDWLCVML